MKRKHFISSTLSLIAGTAAFGKSMVDINDAAADDLHTVKLPTYLKPGDKIGIISPAGYIASEAIQPAVSKFESWGFQTVIGDTIGKRNFTFGGTDEERRADFQNMLDDDSIKAIMCARGGYGLVRIIDQLNFEHFKKHPKWIIGFSDATILHAHIHSNYKTASIHSKMCNSFPSDWSLAEAEQIASLESVDQALKGKTLNYHIKPNANNRAGRATGTLVGGNLKIIETLCGSNSELDTTGKILFLEDTDEYLYSIDRMFWSLKRSGKLSKLKGLIIGGFKIKPDDPGDEFGLTLEQIVLEKIGAYDYPVCFGFPVGHQKYNVALICGAKYQLDVASDGVNLQML